MNVKSNVTEGLKETFLSFTYFISRLVISKELYHSRRE